MKGTRDEDSMLDRLLARHAAPPAERVQSGIDRVRARLRSRAAHDIAGDSTGVDSAPRVWRSRALSLAAAAVLLLAAAGVLSRMWLVSERETRAVVEAVDGALYRLSGSKADILRIGDRIRSGETLRTNGGAGAQLALTDGSRVEMRSQSELALERADDGLRVRLSKGGIIVNAARQRTGHLYVQTKDVTVTVVGTVFMVNADETGSRVAVIEGEVRVHHGASEKTLLPGQQLFTNPVMETIPVREAIGWSRNSEALLLFLQQLAVVPPPIAPQAPQEPRDAFEVTSVRPTIFAAGGARGAGGGDRTSSRPPDEPCGNPRGTRGFPFLQVDGRRFAANDMTLHGLIILAYAMECQLFRGSDFLLGGPGWAKSDGFDIQGLIPEGSPVSTREQFLKGEAPRLQRMLQTLLVDRFKLVLRREMREIPVYELTVAKGGHKLTAWKEGDPVDLNDWIAQLGMPSERELAQQGLIKRDRRWFAGLKFSIPQLVNQLKSVADRPVLDRTGIVGGEFNYQFFYSTWLPPVSFLVGPGASPDAASAPSLFAALEDQLGLRLEPTRTPVEVLAIEKAERPTEN